MHGCILLKPDKIQLALLVWYTAQFNLSEARCLTLPCGAQDVVEGRAAKKPSNQATRKKASSQVCHSVCI